MENDVRKSSDDQLIARMDSKAGLSVECLLEIMRDRPAVAEKAAQKIIEHRDCTVVDIACVVGRFPGLRKQTMQRLEELDDASHDAGAEITNRRLLYGIPM